MYLTSKKACQELGVHANTLRKWASQGKISYIKTDAGQRLYDVKHFIEKTNLLKTICYCRVSSSQQKDDLERQVQYMKERYPEYETIKDFEASELKYGGGYRFSVKALKEGE